MTKTFMGRTWYGWTWWLRPRILWLRWTMNRYNEGVENGHLAARRNLTENLQRYRRIAQVRGPEHLSGYDAAVRIVEKQFRWLND